MVRTIVACLSKGTVTVVVVKKEPSETAPHQPVLPENPHPLQSALPVPEDTQIHPGGSVVRTSPGPSPKKKVRSAMEDLFGYVLIVQEEPAKPEMNRARDEVQRYRSEPVLPVTNNPLSWWKDNQCMYPLLSKLAKSVLNIQGTSVPSERVFSTAGDIVSAQRASLSPQHVDMLIFLKKNMNI